MLEGVFDRLELQLEGTNEEARANEKEIFRKALVQKNPIQHCECLLVALRPSSNAKFDQFLREVVVLNVLSL